jgi:hypothetical protein
MKSRTSLLLLVFVVVAMLGTIEIFTGPAFIHQLINMRRARQHLPIVRQRIDALPALRQVSVVVFDGAGGS